MTDIDEDEGRSFYGSYAWLADQFADIEKLDSVVTKIEVRKIPADFAISISTERGKKVIWNAQIVENRKLPPGTYKFHYQKSEWAEAKRVYGPVQVKMVEPKKPKKAPAKKRTARKAV